MDAWGFVPFLLDVPNSSRVSLVVGILPLPEEREEVLITNLPSETFDYRQMEELYHMRWAFL